MRSYRDFSRLRLLWKDCAFRVYAQGKHHAPMEGCVARLMSLICIWFSQDEDTLNRYLASEKMMTVVQTCVCRCLL